MAILSANGVPLRRGGTIVRNHAGNIAAPPIVTPPEDLLFDLAALTEWPLSNNQFDNLAQSRDWQATLNGPQHRYSGVRYQPTWLSKNRDAFPAWQPAMNRVDRVYRKGATGGLQRVLVFECEHNTNQIKAGDQGWFYAVGGISSDPFEGGVDPAASLDLGGFSLPLKQKLTITGSTPSPDDPAASKSYVEVTFGQDLPAIDFTPPQYEPYDWAAGYTEPVLIFVHHSFYADASTRRLRYPLSWHLDILKFDVLGAGGAVVVGGLQRLPTWSCWTTFANAAGDLALIFDLYRQEQEGLAYHFGDTDPLRLANELENEPVLDWTDAAVQANSGQVDAIGLRTSLLEYMYPMARTAWGPDRTMIVKAGGFGGLDGIWDWDIDNDATWGGANNILGNHNYDDTYAPHVDRNGRQLWYRDRADCDYHAGVVADRASMWKLRGAIMTEWSSPNTLADDVRGGDIGRLHTALAARGIPVCYWDLTGDQFGFAWFYNDVPGSEGKTVQAIIPELRDFCGRAGRSV